MLSELKGKFALEHFQGKNEPIKNDVIMNFLEREFGFDFEAERAILKNVIAKRELEIEKIKNRDNFEFEVKELFKANFKLIYHEEKFVTGWDAGRGDDRDTYVFKEYKEKTIDFESVLKDPYPDSNMSVRVSDWIERLDWIDYYSFDKSETVESLRRHFVNGLKIPIAHEYDRSLKRRFSPLIEVRLKK